MELIQVIQRIAQDCVKGMSLTEITYGKIVSITPLSMEIQPSLFTVTEPVVTDSENVRRKEIIVNGEIIIINAGIAVGDKVIAVRSDSGQRYVILSKV